MHGAKRWLLYSDTAVAPALSERLARAAPRVRDGSELPRSWPVMRDGVFAPNATSASWVREELPRLADEEQPLQCVIRPGDLLYFPKGWWHATLNIGNTVFMSTFL